MLWNVHGELCAEEGAGYLEEWKKERNNQRVLKKTKAAEGRGQHLVALKLCGESQSSSLCLTFMVSDAEMRGPFPVSAVFLGHASAQCICMYTLLWRRRL